MRLDDFSNYIFKDYCRRDSQPKINKCGRLRYVNMGHYSSYFEVIDSIDSEGNKILTVIYHPEILSDPQKIYYKSSTKKGGDFIEIKDICRKWFGEEPAEGYHYELKKLTEQGNIARYKLIEGSKD